MLMINRIDFHRSRSMIKSCFVSRVRGMVRRLAFLTAFYLCSCFEVFADDEPSAKMSFNEIYKQYKEQVAAEDWSGALPLALRSYQLGVDIFDENDASRVVLARDLGLLYSRRYKIEEAKKFLSEALNIAENIYGKKSPELIDILLEVGVVNIRPYKRGSEMRYFKRALKIARSTYGEDSVEYGSLNSTIGNLITQKSMTYGGEKYLNRGVKVLESVAGLESEVYGKAAFAKAKYELVTRDYKQAVSLFLSAIRAFKANGGPTGQLELSAHAFLIDAYENLGETDSATQHCLAIGKMTPQRSKQDFLPIYRATPSYPRTAAENGSEGWVDLVFDVDEAGFVRNPKVVSSQGYSGFKKAALRAAEGYRYAPAFENGEPVLTEGVEIRVSFQMAD